MVKFLCWDLSAYLSLRRWVASISSANMKNGMERDSVMVFVMAFFIPVSLRTSSSGLTPVRGAILTTLSPVEAAGFAWQAPEVEVAVLGFWPPSIKARMSSFKTLPSFPVAGTYLRSIPLRLAILRTAGVAKTLSFDFSTASLSLVRQTVPVSSDYDEEEVSSAFLVSLAGSDVAAPSSTSISINAFPTRHISSFL